MSMPGWYPDPWTAGQQRYYDGAYWTAHVQAPTPVVQQVNVAPAHPVAPQQVHHVQHVQVNQVAVTGPRKSVGVALLLSFLFGPLGMLYSTVVGGLVLFLVNLVLIIPTVGLVLLVTWPLGMVWAALAAQKTNAVSGVTMPVQVSQVPVQTVPVQPYPVQQLHQPPTFAQPPTLPQRPAIETTWQQPDTGALPPGPPTA